jgi:POT family proton-dependent oligopeptide transporter
MTTVANDASATADPRQIFGHPRGLVVLAGTELWDRISFHGMQALLVLYMVGQLFLPGHIETIVGFKTFRALIEGITGPLSVQALASQIFGIYVGLVYFTPVLGGVLGDRVLGRSRTVTLGALLMTAGHFCMAFDQSFLLAMLLLILGAGCLRGNLMPQVAELYSQEDRRRAVAFQLYGSMINLGAFIAPVVTGALGQAYGWHTGFAFAGFGMLLGLIYYRAGLRWLPPEAPPGPREVRVRLRPDERRIVLLLLTVVPVAALFWVAQSQIWNTYNIWVRDHVNLQIGGFTVPVPWLQALDGLAPFLTLPPFLLLWRWQAARGTEPNEFTKMAIGCFIFGGSVMLLAAGAWITDASGRSPLLLAVAFHFASNIGWLYFAPSANSLFGGAAPRSVTGAMIGIYTTSVFFGSLVSGRLGGLYERLTAAQFWTVHAGVVALGGVLLLLVGGRLSRELKAAAETGRLAVAV